MVCVIEENVHEAEPASPVNLKTKPKVPETEVLVKKKSSYEVHSVYRSPNRRLVRPQGFIKFHKFQVD